MNITSAEARAYIGAATLAPALVGCSGSSHEIIGYSLFGAAGLLAITLGVIVKKHWNSSSHQDSSSKPETTRELTEQEAYDTAMARSVAINRQIDERTEGFTQYHDIYITRTPNAPYPKRQTEREKLKAKRQIKRF